MRRQSSEISSTFQLLIPSVLSLISWQFAQFVYSTQLCALAIHLSIDGISRHTYESLLVSHILSLFVSLILLFGNEMLLSSLYLPSIIASIVILAAHRIFSSISLRPLFILILISLFALTLYGSKTLIASFLQIDDDAHIFDILRSKFTDFATFHTRLYTCSAEFGFIQQETLEKLTLTLLLPLSITGLSLVVVAILRSQSLLWRSSPSSFPLSHQTFHLLQTAAFIVMAVLIMRLKLFMTPYLCASLSLIFSAQVTQSSISIRMPSFIRVSLFVGIISAMAYKGIHNLKHQLSIQGEYSNIEQELLFEWINENTSKDAVFAGTMPVMANVKLSTGRPIVNHPHYEDAAIRMRTLSVYSIFSKRPIEDVHSVLKSMGVNYIVIQPFNCEGHPRKECSYRAMWDLHDPSLANRPSLCDIWLSSYRLPPQKANSQVAPFSFAYNKANYIVLKV